MWHISLGIFLVLRSVHADLPVHCHAQEVTGLWEISLVPSSGKRGACQHLRPDLPGAQPALAMVTKDVAAKQPTIFLEAAEPAHYSTGGAATIDGAETAGEWKMVADEGFEISFAKDVLGVAGDGQKGQLRLLAFSRFEVQSKGKQTNTSLLALSMKDLESQSVSKCNETALGWYSVGRDHWGCWFGRRVETIVKKTTRMLAKPTVLERAAKHSKKPLSFAEADERVRRINTRQGTWHARVYHRWLGKTPTELAAHRGVHWQKQRPAMSFLALGRRGVNASKADLKAEAERERVYSAGLAEAMKSLPTSIDWRDARDGKDFLEPVADQGACGSCWAVSGMRMLTARHKIARNSAELVPWSISFPLYCSEYNQGCEGGYGYLLGRWSEDVGLVPANCATYKEDGKSCAVNATCMQELRHSGQKRWRATSPRYIGGRQELISEAHLLQELHERGPIVVGLSGAQIGDDFMFYSGGIYTGEEYKNPDASGGHAVLLVGYGDEDGQPYWIVQNSWGPDWGEDGYVRMSRKTIKFKSGEVADVVEDEQNGRQVDQVVDGAVHIA